MQFLIFYYTLPLHYHFLLPALLHPQAILLSPFIWYLLLKLDRDGLPRSCLCSVYQHRPVIHILRFQEGNCKPTTPRAMRLFCLSLKSLQRGRKMQTHWCGVPPLSYTYSSPLQFTCIANRVWGEHGTPGRITEQARPSLNMLQGAIHLCFPQLAAGLNL